MKLQLTKEIFVLVIAIMIFSVLPILVNAQRNCPDGNCPKGQICFNGYCTKSGGGGGGWTCGRGGCWKTTVTNNPGSQTAAISFSIDKPDKISVNILDMTGRLMKTLVDKTFEQGEHKLQWDAAGVNAGIYIVQFNVGAYSESKKITVVR